MDDVLSPAIKRMIKKHLRFNLIYALLFILVLFSVYRIMPDLIVVTKPSITLLLLIFLAYSTKLKGRFHKRMFTGLIFALAGNVLLSLNGHSGSSFIWGLLAMILCHLFYTGAFYLDFRSAQELDKKGAKIAIISSGIVFTAFYFYLRPHIGPSKLPVLFYIFIMALLVMMAAFRNQRVNPVSFKLIFSGVFFFILTDVIFAHTYLISSSPLLDLVMTASYMIAQYLIIMGAAERELIYKETPI